MQGNSVAIDGGPLVDSPNRVSVYTSYLIYTMLEIRPTLRVYALVFSDDKKKPKLITHKRLEYVYLPQKRRVYESRARLLGKFPDVSKHIPQEIDVALYSNYFTWPWVEKAKKKLVFIHDLLYIDAPQFVPKKKQQLFSKLVPRSIENSNFVITLSANTELRIKELYGTNRPTLRAAPAFNTAIFNSEIQEGDPATLVKYSLPQEYILHLGSLTPRKNIVSIIDAYIMLDDDLKREHPLVLAGDMTNISQEITDKIAQARDARLELHTPGNIDTKDMGSLYRMASAFVMLSHYEGFGMPAVEAMACGVPVVASSIPNLQDVVGDAAMVVKPTDTKEASRTLNRVLKDSDIRDELIKKGYEQAKNYSWLETAKVVLNLL